MYMIPIYAKVPLRHEASMYCRASVECFDPWANRKTAFKCPLQKHTKTRFVSKNMLWHPSTHALNPCLICWSQTSSPPIPHKKIQSAFLVSHWICSFCSQAKIPSTSYGSNRLPCYWPVLDNSQVWHHSMYLTSPMYESFTCVLFHKQWHTKAFDHPASHKLLYTLQIMNPSKEGSPEFCSFAGFAVGDTTFSIFLNYPIW